MNNPLKIDIGRFVLTLSLIYLSGCTLIGTPPDKKLLGQWQGQVAPGKQLILTFDAEGKVFILSNESPVAFESKYQIESNTRPMQLDLALKNGTIQTIFEFTDNNKLRLELQNLNPGNPRPTAFSPNSSLFDKISNTTTLPTSTRVEKLDIQVNKARQAEARQNIGAMSRGQQAYYLENSKFGTTLENIRVVIKPETENYRYEILPQGDGTKSVMMTATAKIPDLQSYTGAVFVVKSATGENLTLVQICATDQPSTTPPVVPAAPAEASEKIQCPPGSTPLW